MPEAAEEETQVATQPETSQNCACNKIIPGCCTEGWGIVAEERVAVQTLWQESKDQQNKTNIEHQAMQVNQSMNCARESWRASAF